MKQEFDLDDIMREFGAEQSSPHQTTSTKVQGANSKRSPDDRSQTPSKQAPRRALSESESTVRSESAPVPKSVGKPSHTQRISSNPDLLTPNSDLITKNATNTKLIATNSEFRIPHSALVLVFVLLTIFAILTGFSIYVTNSGRIYPNVFVDSVSVGGMTSSEALSALDSGGWTVRAETPLQITTYLGITVDVDPVQAGVVTGSETAVAAAKRYGRSGNIYENLISYIKSMSSSTDINELSASINNDYISSVADECERLVRSAVTNNEYYIDEAARELVIIKSSGEITLDKSDLRLQIISALEEGKTSLTYNALTGEAVAPDYQAIYDEVCTGAVNASFSDDGSHTILPEQSGWLFDIDTVRSAWEAASLSEEIRIPLQVVEPEITAEYLESMLYHDLLGAVTTKYNNSNENRSSNVRLASSKIDGVVLYPGEVFSFNDVVGERTEEAGFLLAPAYAGYDDIKDELGGGVCQVSTGVYAAALFAFLEIKSHTCHIYPPNYIQLGTDATVSIPAEGRTIDFKFINSKSYPIKIVSYCEETVNESTGRPLKTVTVEIWGTLEDDDFMPIEFDNSYSDIYDYDRVIDPAYEDREGYKIKLTHDESEFEDDTGKGLRTATHRKVYDSSGNLVQDHIINPTYSAGYALDTYYYRG